MLNKQRHSFKRFISGLALLVFFMMAGEGHSATEIQNPETKPADKASPVPERKAQFSRTNKEPSVFVPTEKISADKDISFPTDI